jgi:hypothetical protein
MEYLARKKQIFATFTFSTGLQALYQRLHRRLQVFILDPLRVALERLDPTHRACGFLKKCSEAGRRGLQAIRRMDKTAFFAVWERLLPTFIRDSL